MHGAFSISLLFTMAEASSFLLRFLLLSLLAVGASQATNTSSSENPENEAAKGPTDKPPVEALKLNGTNGSNSTVGPPKATTSNVYVPEDQATSSQPQQAVEEDSDDAAQLPRSCLPHGAQKVVCPTQGPLEFVCPTPEPQPHRCPPPVPPPQHKPVFIQMSQLLKLLKQLGYSPDGPQQQHLEQEQDQEQLRGLLSKWLQELQQHIYLPKLLSMAHQQRYLPKWPHDDHQRQYHGYQLLEPQAHDAGGPQHYPPQEPLHHSRPPKKFRNGKLHGSPPQEHQTQSQRPPHSHDYPPQEPLHHSRPPKKFRNKKLHGSPMQEHQTQSQQPPHSHDYIPQEFWQPSPQNYPPRGSSEPHLQSYTQKFWDVPPQVYPQEEFRHPHGYPALEFWEHSPLEYPPQEPNSFPPQGFHKPQQHGYPQVPTKPQTPHHHHKQSFKPLHPQIVTRWPAYLPQKPYYITHMPRYPPQRPQNKPRPGNPSQVFYVKAQ